MQSQTFVFFGIAGSGKGTQVKLLLDYLKTKDDRECIYAGTGDMFRKMFEKDNLTTNLVKEKILKGEYIDDFLTDGIVTNLLINSISPEKHLIFDGYPRTISQSGVFEKMMNFFQRNTIHLIYIEVGKEESMRRNFLRGRTDDTQEGLNKRYDEYINKVIPAMNYFQEKSGFVFHKINGEQTVEEVHLDIIKSLKL